MSEEQVNVLVDFMNIAIVKKMDEFGEALPIAMFGGRRRAFEAACAVYQSDIGNINEPINEPHSEGRTCLHEMAQNMPEISQWPETDSSTGAILPPVSLKERFERAFTLGADPLVVAKNGQTPIDVAAQHGSLAKFVHAMGEMTSAINIDRMLEWTNDQGQNILSVAARYEYDAMAEIRKIVAHKFCGNLRPQQFLAKGQSSLSAQESETLKLEIEQNWGEPLDDRQLAALTHYMNVAKKTSASRHDVIDALPVSLAGGHRAEFIAAYEVYAAGIGDINARNDDGHTPLHQLALHQNATTGRTSIAPIAHELAGPEWVGVEERLAVMLGLGADPFSTEKGKLTSPYFFAKASKCTELEQPMSKMHTALRTLAVAQNGVNRVAINHASSAEAVNFLCDLDIEEASAFAGYGSATEIAGIAMHQRAWTISRITNDFRRLIRNNLDLPGSTGW
ncbi:hypothetical protein [Noviherbaspirillum saxi]|uniref:Ankyrin repeat-containing protein n=1 Tax=Noviherbaspirillum saxi TaxID=2320863 RepID=A0A3A3FYY2_9BURK|nr:hypothetical protein [Noviherbaspirillum saxi]RJF92309.1 hypothetical protein D3871_27170 [Noviherbaspirillum saxi]